MSWVEEQSWFGLEDLVLDNIEEQQTIKANFICNQIWTTKEGSSIHIKKMKTPHLVNCINKIKRENWRVYALPILETELKSRNYE
jgi:hypothetical protein